VANISQEFHPQDCGESQLASKLRHCHPMYWRRRDVKMRPTATDVAWSVLCVCLSVCLWDVTVSCAKTTEPVEMPPGMWTRVSQGTTVCGGPHPVPREEAIIMEIPSAMRPFVKTRLPVVRDKKLSYRRGTARCVVSIEILPIATQQCRNYLYDKS